jgi:hypothetical protein
MTQDITDKPRALGWIDPELSPSVEWDRAGVERLARRLGYRLSKAELDRVQEIAHVETVSPRLSFPRRSVVAGDLW